MLNYNQNLRTPARHLRNAQTDAERMLWSKLRRKQIHESQFYRQKPIAGFIVDFYCPSAKLIIELDGGHHFHEDQQAYDIERTQILESHGLQVLRFTNQQITQDIENSVQIICETIAERKTASL